MSTISSIYNSNQILYKTGSRKGKSKKKIEKRIKLVQKKFNKKKK